MNKHITKRILMCMLLVLMTINLFACERSISNFTGSSTGNSKQFLLDFEVLNITESNQMELQQGDKIQTTIEVTKGSVDITVKNEKGTIAYQSNDAETSTLSFEITEQGTYTFSVTGYRAEGSVHFIKVTGESV